MSTAGQGAVDGVKGEEAEGAQNSVKKESPFWDPSIEGERAREP
jgi:hypothetical protein